MSQTITLDKHEIVVDIETMDEIKTALVYALNEIQKPHPNPKNKEWTLEQIKKALCLIPGEESFKKCCKVDCSNILPVWAMESVCLECSEQ